VVIASINGPPTDLASRPIIWPSSSASIRISLRANKSTPLIPQPRAGIGAEHRDAVDGVATH